jgi:hypothetical protein
MTDAWLDYPYGRKIESAPDRPIARFGVLHPATDELLAVLRRNVREIPDDKLERHEGGRYWTDAESGEELEIVLPRCRLTWRRWLRGFRGHGRLRRPAQEARRSRLGDERPTRRCEASMSRRDRHLVSSDMWEPRDFREARAEKLYQPLNETLPPPTPTHSIPAGFSLNAEEQRRRERELRSEQVDHFLEASGVRPRRRAR